MSSVWRRAISIVIVLPLAIAVQQWPAPAADGQRAVERAAVQQVRRSGLGRAELCPGGRYRQKFVPADITWPMAEEATVDLTSRRRGDRVVGTTPIRVAAPADVGSQRPRWRRSGCWIELQPGATSSGRGSWCPPDRPGSGNDR